MTLSQAANYSQRVHLLLLAPKCEMESSKRLCLDDAAALMSKDTPSALRRLERAADYCFGVFSRPAGWGTPEPKEQVSK